MLYGSAIGSSAIFVTTLSPSSIDLAVDDTMDLDKNGSNDDYYRDNNYKDNLLSAIKKSMSIPRAMR